MRRPERIPIVLANIDWEKFLTLEGEKPSDDRLKELFAALPPVIEKWMEYPDLRLGQLLSNEGLVSDDLRNIEEVPWMIEHDMVEPRDIMFWGVNFTKDKVKLPETQFRLIKDLDTAHIEAILSEGHANNYPDYIGYFENELERREEENIHDDE